KTAAAASIATTIRRRAFRCWEQASAQAVAELEETLGRLPTDAEAAEVKVEPVGLHELRHSCVTAWAEMGLSLEEIGDLIGHSSTYMSDRYRHLRRERFNQIRVRLNEHRARV